MSLRFKLPVLALLLLGHAVTLDARADIVGRWRAEFVGPIGPRPKMVSAITFEIRRTAAGLAGTADAGIDGVPDTWPGILQVSDIKIDGDKFSFVGVGSKGWSTGQGGVRTDHCCPRLAFAGTIDGDDMTLTMTWTSTENPSDPTAQPLPMEAKRLR